MSVLGVLFRFALSVLLCVATTAAARAECFTINAEHALASDVIELVFSGRVTEVAHASALAYRYTIEVDGVWKGRVAKRVELWSGGVGMEDPRYEVNGYYYFLATRQSSRQSRERSGIPDSVTTPILAVSCGGELSERFPSELGRARQPERP